MTISRSYRERLTEAVYGDCDYHVADDPLARDAAGKLERQVKRIGELEAELAESMRGQGIPPIDERLRMERAQLMARLKEIDEALEIGAGYEMFEHAYKAGMKRESDQHNNVTSEEGQCTDQPKEP